MKLAYLSTVYPAGLAHFEQAVEAAPGGTFAARRAAFEAEGFGWCGAWGPALAPLGHEVLEVWPNLEGLQRAWAREHGPAPGADAETIALAQLAAFEPDVLWYDHHDAALLARARAACPSIRAVLGWVGSSLHDAPIWREFDLVLTCAPESVERLARWGVPARHLHHAFQERLLAHLGPRAPRQPLTFVGQIAPDHPLHGHRQAVLERLLDAGVPLAIHAPAPPGDGPPAPVVAAKRALFGLVRGLAGAGVPEAALRRVPVLGRAAAWPAPPRGGLPPHLRAALSPACFGLPFFRALRDSCVTLNVHAGEATRFTSNMRLFEATGAGACLLTDAADNLAELFAPGAEVATFRTAEECREKAAWLLAHPAEREAIALAGQRRCLADHTFARRAPQLDAVLRELVA